MADEEKVCRVCGRKITWRKKWENCWDEIRYCSNGCRKRKLSNEDKVIEEAILSFLAKIGPTKSICPSEVARHLYPVTWKNEMERVRCAARRLTDQGKIVITQRGHVVDPSTAKGPIRLRLV